MPVNQVLQASPLGQLAPAQFGMEQRRSGSSGFSDSKMLELIKGRQIASFFQCCPFNFFFFFLVGLNFLKKKNYQKVVFY